LAQPSLPEGIGLDILVSGLDSPVMLDAGSLQDSLLNLILNARDAIASAGGGAGRITLAARPLRDTWLEISVADTGPGFSPEALERGLDPFFTTKGGEGSGLGLTMVYDHTKLSGGAVRLSNRPEGGATVTLRLPLRRAAGAGPAKPLLILLVEDSDDIRTEVREMLRGLGHNVIEAASADEALDLADLPGLDLILSDIGLPGAMTGLDLAHRLAARDHPARLVLMTSLPPGDALRARAGAIPVLSKPLVAAELAAALATPEAG
jgi:CheY-like chemotaxis protein